ncbi:MAG TPA: NAD-dependent epimerase/dehydratase family protein [Actinocrinis sp.]|nr:NAD-dependent epimerase/dehydratase family protein [Actinocrinis sp.]
MAVRVLVTGASGFVGSRVASRLAEAAQSSQITIRTLTHQRTVRLVGFTGGAEGAGFAAETVHADITSPDSLRGICDGVDVVLHLAARFSGDFDHCYAVNVDGTRALLAEAAKAGVQRVVQLSTTAVYRDGVHAGAAESQLEVGPVSAASRTRLTAEELALAAGGVVLRPHLVYGSGDVWVIPALAAALRRIPHWIDGARNRVSMVAVDDLAAAIVRLALIGGDLPFAGRVLHASHPHPLVMRDVLTQVAGALQIPLPQGDIAAADALRLLGDEDDPAARRRMSLLSVDHWYDSSLLWKVTGCPPAPGFGQRFAQYAEWYREHL